MASGKSDFLENGLLNYVFNGAAMPTIPANLFLSLHTAAVGDAGAGAEVTGNGYSRLTVAKNTTNFPTTTTGIISNGTLLQWPTATGGAWGTITSVGVWDAATGGNLLYWGDLTASQTINDNNRFEIPIGDLDISED